MPETYGAVPMQLMQQNNAQLGEAIRSAARIRQERYLQNQQIAADQAHQQQQIMAQFASQMQAIQAQRDLAAQEHQYRLDTIHQTAGLQAERDAQLNEYDRARWQQQRDANLYDKVFAETGHSPGDISTEAVRSGRTFDEQRSIFQKAKQQDDFSRELQNRLKMLNETEKTKLAWPDQERQRRDRDITQMWDGMKKNLSPEQIKRYEPAIMDARIRNLGDFKGPMPEPEPIQQFDINDGQGGKIPGIRMSNGRGGWTWRPAGGKGSSDANRQKVLDRMLVVTEEDVNARLTQIFSQNDPAYIVGEQKKGENGKAYTAYRHKIAEEATPAERKQVKDNLMADRIKEYGRFRHMLEVDDYLQQNGGTIEEAEQQVALRQQAQNDKMRQGNLEASTTVNRKAGEVQAIRDGAASRPYDFQNPQPTSRPAPADSVSKATPDQISKARVYAKSNNPQLAAKAREFLQANGVTE